jgi:DNA gyrase subunit A
MLMTNSGQSVRIAADGISVLGRAAQGVKLMSLREGEKIQDVARVVKDEDDVETGGDTTGGVPPADGPAPADAPSA